MFNRNTIPVVNMLQPVFNAVIKNMISVCRHFNIYYTFLIINILKSKILHWVLNSYILILIQQYLIED